MYLNFIPAYLLIEGGKAYDNDPRQRMTATSSQPALRGVVERPLLLGVLGLSLLVLVMPRAAAKFAVCEDWHLMVGKETERDAIGDGAVCVIMRSPRNRRASLP